MRPCFRSLILCLALSQAVIGQVLPVEADSLVTLDDMVITATRTATPIWRSPVSISMLARTEIERRPVASVADFVRDLPGVFVADNTLPGMQRLRIRGEDARRSLVLIDGQEVSDHTTYGPPILIDPAFIERIELVRGPHSTLYGSRAEGGVINIITRQGDADNPLRFISMGYSGATHGSRVSVGVSGGAGEFDWIISGSSSRDGERRTPEGVLPDTRTAAEGGSARLGWTRESHRLVLLLDHHDMWSEASTPESLLDGVMISKFQLDLPRRLRDKIGLVYDGHDFSSQLRQVHADVFWQEIDREITQEVGGMLLPPTRPPTFYDYFNADTDTTKSKGVNAHTRWQFAESHDLVTGISWVRDDLDKNLTRVGTHRRAGLISPLETDTRTQANIATFALYAEDTWTFAPKWHATFGLRQFFVRSELVGSTDPALGARSDDDAQLIGSAALVYSPVDRLALRARWSQGYVYPTLLHLHTGSLFAQGNLTRPNPTLRPEKSENAELGLRWEPARGMLDLVVFATEALDYIESVSAASLPQLGWAPTENTYANLGRAKSWGIELATSFRATEKAPEFYTQATYLRREIEDPILTTTDYGQPRLRGRTGVRLDGRWSKQILWYVDTYVVGGGRSTRETQRSVTTSEGWITGNLSLGLSWGDRTRWKLNIELLNLGNVSYRPSIDELNQPGRHANLGLKLEF